MFSFSIVFFVFLQDYPDYSQIHWSVSKSSPAYLNEALLRFSLLARGQQQEGEMDEDSDQHITGGN